MDERRSQYTLRRIRNASDAHLAAALSIYVHGIASTYLTDTNEIVHWLDKYKQCFGDELMLFTLSVRRKVVGFAQMVYLRRGQIVVIDYMVLDPGYRKNNVFFEFADQIREYFRSNAWSVRWAAVEVALTLQPRPGADAALLIRLLKLEGFRVARAPYYQPILSLKNLESEQAAVLLLAGDPGLRRIRRETYLNIVSEIYCQHYQRWYSIHSSEEQHERADRMRRLELQIIRELGRTKFVYLNGQDVLLRIGATEDARETSQAERNLATTAVSVAIVILLALAGGALPDPFRLALWGVIFAGLLVAVFLWPSARFRRLLWSEIRFFCKRE